jgi:RNA polymerase sigma-70 factor (ECF subfamily)
MRGARLELVPPATAVLSRTAEYASITEQEFRLLYDRTARPLRAYLYRTLNDLSRADDILQETYLRFLQAPLPTDMTADHRKNYLFRIATNLLRDEAGSRKHLALVDYASTSDIAQEVGHRSDCARFLQQLSARQRELLWLAYVEGFTHKEIAETIGVKASSIRPMLARARQRLSEILKGGGWRSK